MDRTLSVSDDGMGTPTLKCPGCGETWLHHEEEPVEVWQRGEDAEIVGYAILPGGEGVRAIPAAGNPSVRRSGLRLHFRCEICGERFALAIAQHKGQTFVTVEPKESLAE